MKERNNTKLAQANLPWKVKLLYSAGGFGTTIATVMMMGFSLYFYTEICGIRPIVASNIILIAKVWDFINDPMMGAIADRTKSKEGKYRVYLKYFSVPAGIITALCFIMPELTETGKIVWVAVTYTLQGMASTVLSIPYNTMLARITSEPVERAQISAWRGYYGLIANILGGSVTIPLVMLFGKGDMQKGFLWVSIIFGALYALSYLLVFFGTRGYDSVDADETDVVAAPLKENQSLGASIKALITNVPWLCCFALYFIINLATSINGTTMLFYYQYNLDNMALFSIVQTVALFASFPVYAVLKPMVAKFGNAKCAVIGSIVAAAGYLMRFALHDANSGIIVVGFTIGTMGQVLASSIVALIILDCCITYGKWKTGVDNEAILVSGQSISYKVGMALATPIAGYLLEAVPYVANAAEQEESVLRLFYYENTLLPAVGFVIAMIFALVLIRYEKKLPEMRKDLEMREQTAANN